MKAIIQRVSYAKVSVNEEIIGKINSGLLIYMGIGNNDNKEISDKLVKKICNLRIFEDENKKLFLNGFANRKMHLMNLECLKMSLNWFDCDIYATAQNKMSELCLKKCGFVEIGEKEFIYKH